jgi:5'-nucleotidase
VRDQLRVAFDLDSVLFSPDSYNVFSSQGFEAFIKHEQANADSPITQGPLKEFASALGEMQQKFWKNRDSFPTSPIRTYIVTARSACVGERAIKTLRSWGLNVDELHFLSGAPKGPVLEAIKPHIFFDDSHINIESAQQFGTPAAHVKFGAGGYVPKPASQNSTNCTLLKNMSFYDQK